ncbi:hypothetical protein DFH11DRAFT_1616366 [Phellopilus nigrolimitatus]|nr:hypothetical protein DFH11DRAFT_1616366 [Phellopilus nigrolimitatus]
MPEKHNPPNPHKSSRTQEILSNANTALSVASDLAPLVPVPILCSIFTAARQLVDVSVKMRQDKQESAELAEYVADLTCHIHKTLYGKESIIDKDLSLSLKQLCNVLDEVRIFMERQVALNIWQRFRHRCNVSEKLVQYRSRLQYSMQTFTTTSNIRQELSLRYLRDGMDDLKSAVQSGQTFDGQYRIYRWGEIEILNSREPPAEEASSEVEIYDAKVDGEVRVVKVYRDSETFKRSNYVLKLVRERPGLPFAQLDGYASDTSSPFLVLKGGLRNMFDYLIGLDSVDYFVRRLGFMIDMKRAMVFLTSHDLRWKGQVEKLMISESGRLAMGYADDIIERSDTDSYRENMRVMISWPKLGVAEGLHVLEEREDITLVQLYATLQSSKRNQLCLESMSRLWGQYIDELSCGISSFVAVSNSHPPFVGSIGYLKALEDGLHLFVIDNSFSGRVKARTTAQVRPCTDDEELYDVVNESNGSHRREFSGEDVSMPFLISRSKGVLHLTRTSYVHYAAHGWAAEHLSRCGHELTICHDFDLKQLVIVTGVIERISATFLDEDICATMSEEFETMPSIYLNVHPPDQRGFLQKPWGFLSETRNKPTLEHPDQSSDDPYLTATATATATAFKLRMNGVTVDIEQSFKLSCFQFSSTEAAVIEQMYIPFSSI